MGLVAAVVIWTLVRSAEMRRAAQAETQPTAVN